MNKAANFLAEKRKILLGLFLVLKEFQKKPFCLAAIY